MNYSIYYNLVVVCVLCCKIVFKSVRWVRLLLCEKNKKQLSCRLCMLLWHICMISVRKLYSDSIQINSVFSRLWFVPTTLICTYKIGRYNGSYRRQLVNLLVLSLLFWHISIRVRFGSSDLARVLAKGCPRKFSKM